MGKSKVFEYFLAAYQLENKMALLYFIAVFKYKKKTIKKIIFNFFNFRDVWEAECILSALYMHFKCVALNFLNPA